MKKVILILYAFLMPAMTLFAESNSVQPVNQFANIQLGTFIALVVLVLAVSFSVPKFITKRIVKDLVKEEVEKENAKNEKVKKENINLLRTDAHLSRMIAFLLMDKQYYAWAIGWGFRALKRYKEISDDYQKIYREFHELTLHDIIRRCIDCIKDDRSDEIAYGRNDDVASLTKIRAIKDFVDFEYEIYVLDREETYAQELCKHFEDDLQAIHSGMLSLWSELTNGKKSEIVEKILLHSTYKDKSTELDSFIQERYIKEISK